MSTHVRDTRTASPEGGVPKPSRQQHRNIPQEGSVSLPWGRSLQAYLSSLGGSSIRELDGPSDRPWYERALGKFLAEKAARVFHGRRISERTRTDYRKHVEGFFRRHPEAEEGGPALEEGIKDYFGELVKPATYNLRFIYLRTFFDFCAKRQEYRGFVPVNPLRDEAYSRQKDTGRFVRPFEEDVMELLSQPKEGTYEGLRDFVLMTLQIDTGIRPGEALALLPTDVYFDYSFLRIREEIAKTRTERDVPLSDVGVGALRMLLEKQSACGIATRAQSLFCREDGVPLSSDAWSRRIAGYAKKAGIKLRPYDLRHYFAYTYYCNSLHDTFALQTILGHASGEMTRRYTRMQGIDLVKAHNQCSPAARLLLNKGAGAGRTKAAA